MAVVRGTGNLQVPVIVVCGGALNLIPLSRVLIFGAFGYPGRGPSGGAVAMLVYYGLGTLAYAAYLWGRFGVLKLTRAQTGVAAQALTVRTRNEIANELGEMTVNKTRRRGQSQRENSIA